jgi:hypothetical protein
MDVEQLFDQAAERLVAEDAALERGRIFHSTGLKVQPSGKFCAFVSKGELVVKLPAGRVQELLDTGAGRPFDAGKGRPMKEWVRLRPADVAACAEFVAEARRFVGE